MKVKMSGFGNYTEDEFNNLETNYYFIRMGGDFILTEGVYSLPFKEALTRYDELFDELVDLSKTGLTQEDKETGLKLLSTLRMEKVLIH